VHHPLVVCVLERVAEAKGMSLLIYWRELAPYMFSKQRFKEAASQLWPMLKLARPRGKVVLDLGCGPDRTAAVRVLRAQASPPTNVFRKATARLKPTRDDRKTKP